MLVGSAEASTFRGRLNRIVRAEAFDLAQNVFNSKYLSLLKKKKCSCIIIKLCYLGSYACLGCIRLHHKNFCDRNIQQQAGRWPAPAPVLSVDLGFHMTSGCSSCESLLGPTYHALPSSEHTENTAAEGQEIFWDLNPDFHSWRITLLHSVSVPPCKI